jgi:hypothetical protein
MIEQQNTQISVLNHVSKYIVNKIHDLELN